MHASTAAKAAKRRITVVVVKEELVTGAVTHPNASAPNGWEQKAANDTAARPPSCQDVLASVTHLLLPLGTVSELSISLSSSPRGVSAALFWVRAAVAGFCFYLFLFI